jgi:hypothetical protein
MEKSFERKRLTIHDGLKIMSKGLADWYRQLNDTEVKSRKKIAPPFSKREKEAQKSPFGAY